MRRLDGRLERLEQQNPALRPRRFSVLIVQGQDPKEEALRRFGFVPDDLFVIELVTGVPRSPEFLTCA